MHLFVYSISKQILGDSREHEANLGLGLYPRSTTSNRDLIFKTEI